MLQSTRLPLIALVSSLALAACSAPAPEAGNNEAAAENLTLDSAIGDSDGGVVENLTDAAPAPVVVPALPKIAATTPTTDKAPITEAEGIEDEIKRGTGIQRIRHGDGWAWVRDGRILRTADKDGGNIGYFRKGEDRPFVVQRGERTWAYENGKATREFGRDGQVRAPDETRRRDAEDAERGARQGRDQAQRVRDRAAGRPSGDATTSRQDFERKGGQSGGGHSASHPDSTRGPNNPSHDGADRAPPPQRPGVTAPNAPSTAPNPRPSDQSGDRNAQRPDRGERPDRAERPDRPERGARPERPQPQPSPTPRTGA